MKDRESQISAIESTFDAAQRPVSDREHLKTYEQRPPFGMETYLVIDSGIIYSEKQTLFLHVGYYAGKLTKSSPY